MTHWQPVTTAPHGVTVLAWSDHYGRCVTHVIDHHTAGHWVGITHWAPLPALGVVDDWYTPTDWARIATIISDATANGYTGSDIVDALTAAGYTTDSDFDRLVATAATAGASMFGLGLVDQMVAGLVPHLRRVDPADLLSAADVDAIHDAVLTGIDNYGGRNIALDIARALIGAGWTAPGCDDDEYALADRVHTAMPDPVESHYWRADRLASVATDELVHVLIPLTDAPNVHPLIVAAGRITVTDGRSFE